MLKKQTFDKMNIYSFSKEAIKKLATKQTLSIYPILISSLIAVYFIIVHLENEKVMEEPSTLIIMSAVGGFMLIGGFFSSRKAISKVLSDTNYFLKEDAIIKQIPNGKGIKIFFRDIKTLQHTKKGILIKTRKEQILIPIELTDFNELEANIKSKTFTGIQYLDTKFKMNATLLKNVAAIGTLILLVGTLILESKTHKFLAGIPLILVLIFAIYDELKNNGKASLSSEMLAKGALMILSLIAYLVYIAIYS